MKKLIVSLGAVGIVAAALAFQARGVFVDNARNMELRNVASLSAEQTRDGAHVEAEGNPLTGVWRDQNLNITMRKLVLDASGSQAKGLRLQTATVSGNVVATSERDGASTRLQSEQLKIYGGAQATRFDSPGAFTINSNNSARGSTFTSKATSGTVLVPVGGNKPFTSATMNGPVTFASTERDTVDGQPATYTVNGRADKVVIDNEGTQPTITLTGNVQITGEHPTIWAQFESYDRAVLYLDQNFEVQKIEMRGDPAKFSAKPGGG